MSLKCFTPLFLEESISFSSKEFLLRCNTSGLFCGFLISCAPVCRTTVRFCYICCRSDIDLVYLQYLELQQDFLWFSNFMLTFVCDHTRLSEGWSGPPTPIAWRLFITPSLHNSSPCKIEQLGNMRRVNLDLDDRQDFISFLEMVTQNAKGFLKKILFQCQNVSNWWHEYLGVLSWEVGCKIRCPVQWP